MIKKIATAFAALTLMAAPAAAMTLQDGNDRRMQVENHSGLGAYITSVSIMNEHGRSYQLLAPYTIRPGYNRILNFNDGEGHGHCVYSVKATFNNGTVAQRTLNVCTTTFWRIYDQDNTIE